MNDLSTETKRLLVSDWSNTGEIKEQLPAGSDPFSSQNGQESFDIASYIKEYVAKRFGHEEKSQSRIHERLVSDDPADQPLKDVIKEKREITIIDFSKMSIDTEKLKEILPIFSPQSITFDYSDINDEVLNFIATSKTVQEVSLNGCLSISHEALQNLRCRVPAIKVLCDEQTEKFLLQIGHFAKAQSLGPQYFG